MTFENLQLKPKKQTPLVQKKLTIGQPNDHYEQEADAIADQVIQMAQTDAPIQRQCEDCEDETLQMKPLAASITPVVQMQSMEEEEKMVQAKSEGGTMNASASLSSHLGQSKGGGSGLSETTNQDMSNAFGTDFSAVRVHTDSNAVQMNRSLGARAFTHDSDVYFNKGEYSPESGKGKHLLAHELTHVVQQGNESSNILQRSCPQGTTATTREPVTNNDCSHSRETNPDNFITHLYIVPSGRNQASVVALWSGGSIRTFPATLLDSRTPQSLRTPDKVGLKCSRAHTNTSGDHMAYFTGLQREGKNIGFHNSQRVGSGNQSHGCIRVHCDAAKTINENTRSYDATTNSSSTAIIYNPTSIPYSGSSITVYLVRSGDSLGRIARNHSTSVDTLKELNNLPSDRILAGQRLLVPVQ